MQRLNAKVRRWGDWAKLRACDKARQRKAKHALRRARRECAEAVGRFDAFEAALDTLRGALECVDIATGVRPRRHCTNPRAPPRPRVIGHPRPRALRASGQARSCV